MENHNDDKAGQKQPQANPAHKRNPRDEKLARALKANLHRRKQAANRNPDLDA